ncbi:NEK10 [Symbiodinium necroappetens]|uniref:NEK10 protein n=1 Tax=Symbiodinium necroappetens TaxID=1628268 RepID=A0A812NSH3_9DINO|nr:NEK10 [Symbiodinium necroappetens]
MCMDDECALKLRLQADGFVALGALMLELSPSLGPHPLLEDDVEGSFECQARDVQRAAARLLRFLFAVERNRKAFKHIFAVEKLLARFVDIGNYVWPLEAYDSFLEVLNGLTEKELTFLHTRFGRYRDFYSKGRDMPTLAVPQPKTADGTNSPNGFREGTRDEWDCERVIAGYELVECVGSGAFGRVHLARRPDMPGDFAVKEIPLSEVTVLPNPAQHECTPKAHSPQNAPQEVVAEDINLEVHLLRQLDHPNVVRYFTSFITGAGPASTLWIVMEFCSGVPLQALTASAKEKGLQKLPEQQAWRIFVQICLALRYLHIDKRIAHRDLSPNNVLVQSHSLAVKVTDFGLARQKGGAASLMKSMVGTILYCSPEIVQHRPYTNKVDVWALGCLLYRMATLRDPFTGGNPISVARKIVECDYERLGSEHSQLMQVTCEECLAIDPEKRPGIEEVCQLITPAFMQQLEAVQRNMTSYWGSDMQTMQGSHYTGTSVWEDDGSVQGRCTPTESPSPRTPSEELSCPTPGPGGKNLVRVPRRALRTVTDPAQKAMAVVHRLAFLGHLPGCDDSQDSHHWAVCRYQEWLFSSPSHAAILKREVTRLMQRSAEPVECRDTFGQPPLRGSAGADVAALALSYEQLYQYVIRVSSFYGYSCVPETGPPLSSMPSVGSHNSAG